MRLLEPLISQDRTTAPGTLVLTGTDVPVRHVIEEDQPERQPPKQIEPQIAFGWDDRSVDSGSLDHRIHSGAPCAKSLLSPGTKIMLNSARLYLGHPAAPPYRNCDRGAGFSNIE